MTNQRFRAAALVASMLVGTAGAAFAQTQAPADTAVAPAAEIQVAEDDGFDLGWLGLIGLLGLAGLARRREPVRTHTTPGTAGTTRV